VALNVQLIPPRDQLPPITSPGARASETLLLDHRCDLRRGDWRKASGAGV